MFDTRGLRRLFLLSAILTVGCSARARQPTSAAAITGANIPPGAAAAQSERMPRCPNVVPGAVTIVSEVPGGVELRIVGEGEATSEIRRRASRLATAAEETRGKHRANGALDARFGRCPVVMRNTKLEVRDVPNGAAIIVRPSTEQRLGWLRREVEARAAQLASPKPFGDGLLEWCPSAVPGSETGLTNQPYGVDVKVTAASADGIRAIRDRAKHLATEGAVANERCPTSVADSKLSITEVPGGVSIAVKAKRKEDAAMLRHEVHERACAFEPPAGE